MLNEIYWTYAFERRVKNLLSPYGITKFQFMILVEAKQGNRANKITMNLFSDKATVHACMMTLVEKGLITQSKSSVDGRAKDLTLTEGGNKLVQTILLEMENNG